MQWIASIKRIKTEIFYLITRGWAMVRRQPSHLLAGLTFFFILLLWIMPPAAYPQGRVIRIEKGMTIAEAGRYLESRKVIQSEHLFILLVKLWPGESKIIAGDYILNRRQTVLGLVRRFQQGDYEIEPIRVRIPEGATVHNVASILERHLPEFNRQEFLLLASTSEGYLFPDTYFFLPSASTSDIFKEMRENFEARLDPLRLAIFRSNRRLDEIITMASLLEKEAHTTTDREIIAGILWKRADEGMRLQVDAVFPYLIGKNTFDLTRNDLRYNSPYNTYRYAGLPPGPIGSPSLDSIKAALNPVNTPYWFYLSDLKSEIHYARDYEQHLVNKNKYLR